MDAMVIDYQYLDTLLKEIDKAGQSVSFLCLEQKLLGIIVFKHTLRFPL